MPTYWGLLPFATKIDIAFQKWSNYSHGKLLSLAMFLHLLFSSSAYIILSCLSIQVIICYELFTIYIKHYYFGIFCLYRIFPDLIIKSCEGVKLFWVKIKLTSAETELGNKKHVLIKIQAVLCWFGSIWKLSQNEEGKVSNCFEWK